MSIRTIIKKWIPPIVYEIHRKMHPNNYLYYFNEYDSWEEAQKASQSIGGNYENKNIIDRVDEAIQKVRNGEAVYEQDGICFYEQNNNWELLAALFYVKSMIGNISVLDMGGSLGSTWFRYRGLLKEIQAEWCVVEQRHYVDRGRETVPEIDFYYTIDEAVDSEKSNILLLSSVLMYLEEPYRWLENMMSKNFEYIIIDENAFFVEENHSEKIMLQHVPESIYSAVYPAYIFGLEIFKRFVDQCGYDIIWEWVYRGGQIPIKMKHGYKNTIDKGFLLKKRI